MSLWANYSKEMGGAEFIEYDWGFISYEEGIDCLALKDIFIIPEERRHGLKLLNQLVSEAEGIAKRLGKPFMTGQIIIDPNDSKASTKSLKLHLGIGFEPYLTGFDSYGRNVLYLRRGVK